MKLIIFHALILIHSAQSSQGRPDAKSHRGAVHSPFPGWDQTQSQETSAIVGLKTATIQRPLKSGWQQGSELTKL
jgi:hypothetical protein